MADPLLLDTCAAIWVANDDPIGEEARDAIAAALRANDPIYVSPISAWEIGLLAAAGFRRVWSGLWCSVHGARPRST